MLRIRMSRGGAKKRPYYAIVVADSHSPRDGRFIERVGSYNPLLKKDDPNRITLKAERLQEWIRKGAQPTDRVARFMAAEGLMEWQHGNNPNKAKPGKKAEERATQKAERAAAAAAAPPVEEAAPAAEEPAVSEAPAEEAAAAEEAPPAEAAAEAPAEEAAAEAPAEEAPPEEAQAEEAAPEAPAEEAPAEDAGEEPKAE